MFSSRALTSSISRLASASHTTARAYHSLTRPTLIPAVTSLSTPHSSLLTATPSSASPLLSHLTRRHISDDRGKGVRSKRANATQDEDGETAEGATEQPTPDSAEVVAAKKAARAAKKAKKAAAEAAVKKTADDAKKVKQASQVADSLRQKEKFKLEVIEKEVPLMDLTGIKPEQNKFANVLTKMKDEKFPEDVIQELEQIGNLATGSTQDILSGRIANIIEKYGRKPYDCGSPEVQVAILTERLKGYDRHMIEHKSDINSRRGFLAIWHRRRKTLKYLRHTKYETYAYMMKELNLREADIDNVGLSRTSGTQAARIKRD